MTNAMHPAPQVAPFSCYRNLSACASPDASMVAWSEQGVLRIWYRHSGECHLLCPLPDGLENFPTMPSRAYGMQWSPDGSRLLVLTGPHPPGAHSLYALELIDLYVPPCTYCLRHGFPLSQSSATLGEPTGYLNLLAWLPSLPAAPAPFAPIPVDIPKYWVVLDPAAPSASPTLLGTITRCSLFSPAPLLMLKCVEGVGGAFKPAHAQPQADCALGHAPPTPCPPAEWKPLTSTLAASNCGAPTAQPFATPWTTVSGMVWHVGTLRRPELELQQTTCQHRHDPDRDAERGAACCCCSAWEVVRCCAASATAALRAAGGNGGSSSYRGACWRERHPPVPSRQGPTRSHCAARWKASLLEQALTLFYKL